MLNLLETMGIENQHRENMSKVSMRSKDSILKRPIIVATIPAYNEERMIARVIIDVQEYVDKVIVVDDGSTDLTAEIAGDSQRPIVVRFKEPKPAKEDDE